MLQMRSSVLLSWRLLGASIHCTPAMATAPTGIPAGIGALNLLNWHNDGINWCVVIHYNGPQVDAQQRANQAWTED